MPKLDYVTKLRPPTEGSPVQASRHPNVSLTGVGITPEYSMWTTEETSPVNSSTSPVIDTTLSSLLPDGSTSTVTENAQTTSSEMCHPVCPQEEGLFQHFADCSKFFHCAHWHAYEKNCPAGSEFSGDIQRCEWPASSGCIAKIENSICDSSESISNQSLSTSVWSITQVPLVNYTEPEISTFQSNMSTSNPTHITSSAPDVYPHQNCTPICPTEEGLFQHYSNCTKFYHCANWHAYEKDCPSGLEFSADRTRCEWAHTFECRASISNSICYGNIPSILTHYPTVYISLANA